MKYILLSTTLFFQIYVNAQNVGIGINTPSDQLHTTGTVRLQNYSGIGTRLLQIDSLGKLVATKAGAIFSNNTAQTITDNGCVSGSGISSSITISGQPNVAIQSSKIAVKVNITHPYVGDLKIYLFPPSINVLTLANGNGGNGDNFTNTIFSDQAATFISTGIAPFTGQYKPIGGIAECNIPNTAVSNFNSIGFGTILPNGTWTLKVYDAAGTDVGVLINWSISFTGAESFITADENNFIPKFKEGNLTSSSIFEAVNTKNIGIGNTNPTAKLDVSGALKIADGSQGLNKVLTSDANGLASWKNAAYGNLERFQFNISRLPPNNGNATFTTFYNYGTNSGYSNNLNEGTDKYITININKPGLYHFDWNLYSLYFAGNYTNNGRKKFSVTKCVSVPSVICNIVYLTFESYNADDYLTFTKGFDIYIAETGASLYFNTEASFSSTADYFYMTLTGHLIAE